MAIYDPKTGIYYNDQGQDTGMRDRLARSPSPEGISGNIATTPSGVQVDMTTGQTITGAVLAPTPGLNYQTPQTEPVSDIGGLEAADITGTLTKPEKEESDINRQIIELNRQLLGQSQFRTSQETLTGIPESETALDDLNVRLRDLQRQEKAIPLQLERESASRGRTFGGVAPLQTERLRDNAIEALTVSSLIDATTNRLTSAQRKVDRAVAQKFNPLIEEKNALIENARLIKDSPEYSAADRKRAAQVIAIQQREKTKLEEQKTEQKEIWDIATQAVANGLRDTRIMERIRTAKTKEEALGILTESGFGRKPSTANIGDLSPAQQNAAFKLADDYERASKTFFEVRDSYNRVQSSAQNPSAAGDLALIFNYMKMLDPGSVVREGEFATAQNAGGVPDRIVAQYNKVISGERLSGNQRGDFVDRAKRLFDTASGQQGQTNSTYANRAQQFGIPSDFVVRDTSSTFTPAKSGLQAIPPAKKTEILDDILSGKPVEEIGESAGFFDRFLGIFGLKTK